MGQMISWFRGLFGERKVQILVLGLEGAGKTTLLKQLRTCSTYFVLPVSQLHPQFRPGEHVTSTPTSDFSVEEVVYKNIKLLVWDLSVGKSVEPYLRSFYASTDAIIYVVDSADKDKIDIARQELMSLLAEDELSNAVLAVLANKQDASTCFSSSEFHRELGLHSLHERSVHVFKTSLSTGDGLDEVMNWLSIELQTKR